MEKPRNLITYLEEERTSGRYGSLASRYLQKGCKPAQKILDDLNRFREIMNERLGTLSGRQQLEVMVKSHIDGGKDE